MAKTIGYVVLHIIICIDKKKLNEWTKPAVKKKSGIVYFSAWTRKGSYCDYICVELNAVRGKEYAAAISLLCTKKCYLLREMKKFCTQTNEILHTILHRRNGSYYNVRFFFS